MADILFPPADSATDGGCRAPQPISPVEWVPSNYFTPLDLAAGFPRVAPLEVDLGCGDGTFLVAMAERFPERNFLGIERLFGRVSSACGRAARQAADNVRILRVETAYAVEYLLPPASVATAHLLFPDPWPKQRHHRRRLVTARFLAALHRAFVLGGRFHVATDQADYFTTIRELAADSALREEPVAPEESFPLTTFEKHFRKKGAPIYRLRLRKTA